MSTILLTPMNQGASVTAAPGASGTRRFRKQILPLTTINYGGRKIKFDRKFMTDLVRSFKGDEKGPAYDQVPFQLADGHNRHNNDPRNTAGHLVDLELASDGLYGVFDLTAEGAKILENHQGRLGVSARIEQMVEHADGRTYPRAIQHVLGTVDPRVTRMKPWETVDLANDEAVTETIDLSTAEYPGGHQEEDMPKSEQEDRVTVELSRENLDLLNQVLEDQKAALALANEDDETEEADDSEGDGTEGTPPEGTPSEDEDSEDEDADDSATGSASLSRGHVASIELAKTKAELAEAKVLELTRQLRQADVERELETLSNTGLAPSIIEAARPLIEMAPQTLELSNGSKSTVDPAAVVKDVLKQVTELARSGHAVLDFDRESGALIGSDSVQETRASLVNAWADEYGN